MDSEVLAAKQKDTPLHRGQLVHRTGKRYPFLFGEEEWKSFASISVVIPPSKKMRVRDDALLRTLTAASKKKPEAKVILFVVTTV
jgi:hypothetical protein